MRYVAVDACCLINLLAAGGILPQPSTEKGRASRQLDAPSSLDTTLHIPDSIARETLYLLQPDEDDETKLVKAPIDLAPYFADGLLHACDIEGEEEVGLFVQFATRLDDGEAECLAIARHRGWFLATDDRPATALAGQAGVPVLTTAELVKHWAKRTRTKKPDVAAVLRNIQRFAKFVPRRNSPEAAWWLSRFP